MNNPSQTKDVNELNNKLDKELAEQYAKDFGISYDRISIKEKTGWVSYKTDTGGSGGWTEGTPATTIKLWIIKKHYALITEQVRLGKIDELLRFDEWLRERSHLDLRMVAGRRVRDHIWIRKSDLERSQLKSTTLLEGGK